MASKGVEQPFLEDDERFVLSREARQRDENRIRRFEKSQRHKRKWIKFTEIAEWVSELGGSGPNEAAGENAYTMLKRDILASRFEEGGHAQVLFLIPGLTLKRRMTRQRLQDAIEYNLDNEHGRSLLENCWFPRNIFERWCAWHHLPKSPPRFQAPQESRARISPEATGRAAEILIFAPMFAPQPVVTLVDQSEVPSGIEPRVRVPTPQDGGEPRSLVQDSPLPSDECSDLNTQRNKGGRPPAVDWEALRDPLAEEIKIHGFPQRRNPPGWRGTKDVADWAEAKLGKEAKDVARRTIEDNIRKIINELRASTAKPVSR